MPSWPVGNSEMAARMREFDWTATPLGTADRWPAGLRTVVETMLAMPVVASVAVGPDRLLLYNDGAAPFYGDKHPSALGRPLAETFAHEFYRVAPLYDRVFNGEAVHLPAQPLDPSDSGATEVFDAYLTPVRDDDGEVVAAHMMGFAVGDRIRAEAAVQDGALWLAAQKEAFKAAMDGAPLETSLGILTRAVAAEAVGRRAAFYIAHREGSGLSHVIGMGDAYARAVDGFAISPESLACGLAVATGKPVITPDVETEERWREWTWLARDYGYRGCWSFPVETATGRLVGSFALYFPEPREAQPGDHKLAAAVTQTAAIIISRHQENEERTRAVEALRQSEQRRDLALQAAEMGTWDYDLVADVCRFDARAQKLYSLPSDALDHRPEGVAAVVHPDDVGAMFEVIQKASDPDGDGRYDIDYRIAQGDGGCKWLRAWGKAEFDGEGAVRRAVRIVGASRDVTLEKETQARLAAELAASRQLQAVSTKLISEQQPDALYEQLLDAAMTLMQADAASLQMLEPDGARLRLLAWRNFAPESAARWQGVDASHKTTCGIALEQNARILVEDVDGSSAMTGSHDLIEFRRSGIRSVQSTPLIGRGGKRLGMISTHWHEPHRPTSRDFDLFDVLARQAADLIERTLNEAALRDSEELRRIALDSGGMGAWTWDTRAETVRADEAVQRLWGLSSSKQPHAVSLYADLMDPEGAAWLESVAAKTIAPGEEFQTQVQVAEGPTSRRWVQLRGRAESDAPWIINGVSFDITEQRLAEQKLRESEEKFSALFEASPAPFLVVRPDTPRFTIVEVNDAYLAATMRMRETVLGRGIFEAYPDSPDNQPGGSVSALRASLEHVLASKQPDTLPSLKYDIARPDGRFEERWWSPVNSPVLDENGEVEAIIHNANDVTEDRRAEAALRESEEKYRELLERIEEGFCIVEIIFDAAGKPADLLLIEVNPAFESHTGIANAKGRLIRDIVPDLEQHWFDFYGQVARTGETLRFEAPAKALGDRHYEFQAFRVGDPEQRHVAIVFSDITQRQRDAAALRESQERYHALFAGSPVPFMVLDPTPPDFTITGANEAYFAATLTTRETLVGRRLFDVVTDDPSRPGQLGSVALNESLKRVLATKRTDAMPRVRYDIVTPGGGFEPHWWLAINAPMLDAAGEISTIIHQVSRVTELHYAEEAEREYQERRAFLLRLSDSLRPLTDDKAIQRQATRLLGEYLRADRSFIAEVDEDGLRMNVREEYLRFSASSALGDYTFAQFGDFVGSTLHAGDILAVENVSALTTIGPAVRATYAAVDIEAALLVPLLLNGRLAAYFALNQRTPRAWSDADKAIAQQAADRAWNAIVRARAEAALRESETRLRQFGEASQDVLWIRDVETLQWTYLTPAFETIYGLDREAALSGDNYRSWLDLIVPEDRDHANRSIRRVGEGQYVTFEYRVRRPVDGEVRWLRNTDFPITDAAGRVILIGGTGHDFTDVREAEQRLKTLMEGIPQLVWRAAEQGDWSWASPQWAAYTGQAGSDGHGHGWLEPVHPDDRPAALEAWSHAIEGSRSNTVFAISSQRNIAGSDHARRPCATAPARSSSGWAPRPTFTICVSCRSVRAFLSASFSIGHATSWASFDQWPTEPAKQAMILRNFACTSGIGWRRWHESKGCCRVWEKPIASRSTN